MPSIFATATRKISRHTLGILLLSLLVSVGPTSVRGQSSSPEEDGGPAIQISVSPRLSPIRAADLDKWMSSRIIVVTIASAVLGFAASFFYLTKIPFGPAMNAEPRARRTFVLLLGSIFYPVVVLLLFADMSLNRFSGKDVFALVSNLFGLQGLFLMLISLVSFSLSSGLTARIKPFSHCPFLMFPKRQARS